MSYRDPVCWWLVFIVVKLDKIKLSILEHGSLVEQLRMQDIMSVYKIIDATLAQISVFFLVVCDLCAGSHDNNIIADLQMMP